MKVEALIGNGNSSTIHTLLTAPPVFHETITVSSQVPAGIVTDSIAVGRICSPPMFAILPQETAEKSLGPFPPALPSEVAKADNHATDDLNAPLCTPSSSLPPVGSGAIFPSSISPTIISRPS